MKRFAPFLAVLAALALALPALASPRLIRREIGWHITSQGSPASATAIYGRDTTYVQFGLGGGVYGTAGADTTAWFSFQDPQYALAIPPLGNSIASTVDTTVVAWVMVTSDSSVSTASTNFGATTYEPTVTTDSLTIQATGLWPGVSQAPMTINGLPGVSSSTSGDEVMVYPLIFSRGSFGLGAGVNGGINSRWGKTLAYPDLRLVFSSITGAMRRARAFLVYWTDSNSNP